MTETSAPAIVKPITLTPAQRKYLLERAGRVTEAGRITAKYNARTFSTLRSKGLIIEENGRRKVTPLGHFSLGV